MNESIRPTVRPSIHMCSFQYHMLYKTYTVKRKRKRMQCGKPLMNENEANKERIISENGKWKEEINKVIAIEIQK